jgi:outer membrane protein assembly factor BamB
MDQRAIRLAAAASGLLRRKSYRVLLIFVACAVVAAIVVVAVRIWQPAAAGTGTDSAPGTAGNLLRDGWDSDEPGLSPAVVRGPGFGQLFATAVNGAVLAQPVLAGGTLVVATENDWVYGLSEVSGSVRWSRRLGKPVPNAQLLCSVLGPASGITSTPVYDPASGLVYLVAENDAGPAGTTPQFFMYALQAQSGAVAWRVAIGGVPANDPGQPFRAAGQLQRPSLLQLGGWIYAAFGARCEGTDPHSGYVVGVDTANRAQTMWTDEAGAYSAGGGIWQSGSGLMSDGPGRIFLATGDGLAPPPAAGSRPPAYLGDSVVQLGVRRSGALFAADFFSPANAPLLGNYDTDLASGGPAGLPFGTRAYPHLLTEAGKYGKLFVLNRDDLGGRETGPGGSDAVVAQAGPFDSEYGRTAAFAGSGGADYIYYAGAMDYLRALQLTGQGAHPALTDVANSTATVGYASGSPVVTSDGSDPGSAVLWEVAKNGGSGALEAFGAIPQRVGGVPELKQIWSAPIDLPGNFSTVATGGGRLYVATRPGLVYGFGATDSAPLSSSAVSIGPVPAGATGHALVSVTARTRVTVLGISTAGAGNQDPFSSAAPAIGHRAVSLPVTPWPRDRS